MIKNQIGTNAGVVWTTLNASNSKLSINDLQDKTQLTEVDILIAVGWLAREGKVVIFDEGGIMYFSTYHEMYY